MITSQLTAIVGAGNRVLPTSARTRNGVIFDPTADHWSFRDGVHSISLRFPAVEGISTPMRHSLKQVMLWYAENMSPAFLLNGFAHLKRLFKDLSAQRGSELDEITSTDLINFRASLGNGKQWRLGYASGFLKQWHGLRLFGVSEDAIAYLNSVRLPGNAKGVAVLTMDPEHGPFTSIELGAIHSALNNAYAKGEMSLGDFLLCWLLVMLGQRPVQYAFMKVCDVPACPQADGQTYIVRIPRVKQRGALPRSSFKERALIPQIGAMLQSYAGMVKVQFKGKLADPSQAPLFPEKIFRSEYSEGMEFHQTGPNLGRRAEKILRGLQVMSERTGRPMHITPTRFRRTVGTRAAAEGHGALIIADLLDHTDTQNVWVYVEATPEMVERIDRAMSLRLAPLAQAFAGVIVEDDPRESGDPASRIVAPQCTKNFMPVGSCGKHGFCDFAAPIACYTCRKFRAWFDGPHEAVLAYLIAERERLIVGTDSRIAAVNDRTILAVAQVVKQCQDLRAGGQHE